MKYLVVIVLVALLFVLLYRWLLPYLKTIRNFVVTIRQFQQTIASPPNRRAASPEKLVRCEACGIWIPSTRALASRSGEALFCSADCLSGKQKRSA